MKVGFFGFSFVRDTTIATGKLTKRFVFYVSQSLHWAVVTLWATLAAFDGST